MRFLYAAGLYHLCRLQDCPGSKRRLSAEEALDLLRAQCQEPAVETEVRRLLMEAGEVSLFLLDGPGILNAVAALLWQRRLCCCEEGETQAAIASGGAGLLDVTAAPPPGTSRPPSSGGGADPLPQALAVPMDPDRLMELARAAAEEGAPFLPLESRKKTWIECELVGEDDKPVPGVHYTIRLPDGVEYEGCTDAYGRLRYDGIDPGVCAFSLDLLDRDVWVQLGAGGGGD